MASLNEDFRIRAKPSGDVFIREMNFNFPTGLVIKELRFVITSNCRGRIHETDIRLTSGNSRHMTIGPFNLTDCIPLQMPLEFEIREGLSVEIHSKNYDPDELVEGSLGMEFIFTEA